MVPGDVINAKYDMNAAEAASVTSLYTRPRRLWPSSNRFFVHCLFSNCLKNTEQSSLSDRKQERPAIRLRVAVMLHYSLFFMPSDTVITAVQCTTVRPRSSDARQVALPVLRGIVESMMFIMWPTMCGHIMKRCGCLSVCPSVCLSVCHVSYLENGAR